MTCAWGKRFSHCRSSFRRFELGIQGESWSPGLLVAETAMKTMRLIHKTVSIARQGERSLFADTSLFTSERPHDGIC